MKRSIDTDLKIFEKEFFDSVFKQTREYLNFIRKLSSELIDEKQEEFFLLREQEASNILEIKARTLKNWRRLGIGPAYIKISRKCIRYRKSDLIKWLSESKNGSRKNGIRKSRA